MTTIDIELLGRKLWRSHACAITKDGIYLPIATSANFSFTGLIWSACLSSTTPEEMTNKEIVKCMYIDGAGNSGCGHC